MLSFVTHVACNEIRYEGCRLAGWGGTIRKHGMSSILLEQMACRHIIY
jgi:hypothetical protein